MCYDGSMSDLPADDNQVQPQPPVGQPIVPAPKEQKEGFGSGEVAPTLEMGEEAEEEEIESWAERLERGEDVNLPAPVTDDQTGQVLVAPAKPSEPDLVLPVTEEEIKKGLHLKIWESLRWLAEWSMRVFKMFPGRVVYKDG